MGDTPLVAFRGRGTFSLGGLSALSLPETDESLSLPEEESEGGVDSGVGRRCDDAAAAGGGARVSLDAEEASFSGEEVTADQPETTTGVGSSWGGVGWECLLRFGPGANESDWGAGRWRGMGTRCGVTEWNKGAVDEAKLIAK